MSIASTLSTAPAAALPSSPASRTASRWLGAALIGEALLAFAPVIVLGQAIGWPASLGLPAAEQMGRIAAAPGAVALGYGLYLLYSIAIAPLLIVLAARVWGSLAHPAAAIVAVFVALSALARSIGILRWLTVMPELASAHAAADAGTRRIIEITFEAVHAYGGGIGELLGVSLFMALALGTLVAGAWRRRAWSRPLLWLGAVTTVALASLVLPAVGLPLAAPMAAAVTLLSLFLLGLGVRVWRQA